MIEDFELWTLADERRWVAVHAEWNAAWATRWRSDPAWGVIRIETDTGILEACDAYRRVTGASLQ
jgi:hypothetical protein